MSRLSWTAPPRLHHDSKNGGAYGALSQQAFKGNGSIKGMAKAGASLYSVYLEIGNYCSFISGLETVNRQFSDVWRKSIRCYADDGRLQRHATAYAGTGVSARCPVSGESWESGVKTRFRSVPASCNFKIRYENLKKPLKTKRSF